MFHWVHVLTYYFFYDSRQSPGGPAIICLDFVEFKIVNRTRPDNNLKRVPSHCLYNKIIYGNCSLKTLGCLGLPFAVRFLHLHQVCSIILLYEINNFKWHSFMVKFNRFILAWKVLIVIFECVLCCTQGNVIF